VDVQLNYEEFPVFIPFGDDHLCAIVCTPKAADATDVGAVLLTGGNYTRTHRNRMWVRAARALAENGVPSIRLDYHGIGDSTGTAHFELEVPFDADAVCAAEFLQRATGIEHLALVATCFGGRGAMAAAAQLPHAVSATVFPVPLVVPKQTKSLRYRARLKTRLRQFKLTSALLDRPSVSRTRTKIAARRDDSADEVSPRFKRDLVSFSQRGSVRFVFGEHSPDLPGLRRCLAEIDPRLTADQKARITLDLIAGTDLQRFQSLSDQEIVVQKTVESVAETARQLALRQAG
jgi:pimeloyl-ACP methyl ester carboxylesterase